MKQKMLLKIILKLEMNYSGNLKIKLNLMQDFNLEYYKIEQNNHCKLPGDFSTENKQMDLF